MKLGSEFTADSCSPDFGCGNRSCRDAKGCRRSQNRHNTRAEAIHGCLALTARPMRTFRSSSQYPPLSGFILGRPDSAFFSSFRSNRSLPRCHRNPCSCCSKCVPTHPPQPTIFPFGFEDVLWYCPGPSFSLYSSAQGRTVSVHGSEVEASRLAVSGGGGGSAAGGGPLRLSLKRGSLETNVTVRWSTRYLPCTAQHALRQPPRARRRPGRCTHLAVGTRVLRNGKAVDICRTHISLCLSAGSNMSGSRRVQDAHICLLLASHTARP
jgi:hypothetical protein